MAFLDKNGLIYLKTKLDILFNNKVDKVDGKGLSTNDYSNAEKQKLSGIANRAQVNILESISVNGTLQKINNKGVNISVPTTVASLTDASEYAKKTDLTNVYQYKGSVSMYSELPQDLGAITGTSPVYNVEDTGKNYAWNGTAWDDLGGMFEMNSISNGEIDTIFS